MSKLLLLNGPRGCGKSEAVRHLKQHFPLIERRCKDHLFTLVCEFFCLDRDAFFTIYNDRSLKEEPHAAFLVSQAAYQALGKVIDLPERTESCVDLSVRQAMIYVSEVICKPTFGKDYFGRSRVNSMAFGELAIDDSCGFDDEVLPAIQLLGSDNVLLLRIFGRGDFDGEDSRKYITDGVVPNTLDIYNTGTEQEFLDHITDIAKVFYVKEAGWRGPLTYDEDLEITSIDRSREIQDELEGWILNKGDLDFSPDTPVMVRLVNGETLRGYAARFDWLSFGSSKSIYKYMLLDTL